MSDGCGRCANMTPCEVCGHDWKAECERLKKERDECLKVAEVYKDAGEKLKRELSVDNAIIRTLDTDYCLMSINKRLMAELNNFKTLAREMRSALERCGCTEQTGILAKADALGIGGGE